MNKPEIQRKRDTRALGKERARKSKIDIIPHLHHSLFCQAINCSIKEAGSHETGVNGTNMSLEFTVWSILLATVSSDVNGTQTESFFSSLLNEKMLNPENKMPAESKWCSREKIEKSLEICCD